LGALWLESEKLAVLNRFRYNSLEVDTTVLRIVHHKKRHEFKEKDEDCSYRDMNKSKAPMQQLIMKIYFLAF
jgi:hypothetical protein